MRSRRARVLVAVAVALVVMASCRNPGPSRTAATSVDDLARHLAGSGDDAARWEDELRAANGGRTTVDDKIANQLRERTATVDGIWDATQEVSDLACEAWTNGGEEIMTDGLTPLTTQVQAQQLLNRMYADTAQGSVAADSVMFACELAGLADSGL